MLVTGLTGAPQDNGKRGKVVAFDPAKGHYQVKLDVGGNDLSLKPVNVSPMSSKAELLIKLTRSHDVASAQYMSIYNMEELTCNSPCRSFIHSTSSSSSFRFRNRLAKNAPVAG